MFRRLALQPLDNGNNLVLNRKISTPNKTMCLEVFLDFFQIKRLRNLRLLYFLRRLKLYVHSSNEEHAKI